MRNERDTLVGLLRDLDVRLTREERRAGGGGGGGGAPTPTDHSPAYIGPRRDGSIDIAQFSNVALPGRGGFIVFPDGTVTNIIKAGSLFQWTEVAADGVTETWFADLSRAKGFHLGNGRFQYGHPQWGANYWGLWPDHNPSEYLIMRYDADGGTMINSAGQIDLRLNNSNRLSVHSSGTNINGNGDVSGQLYVRHYSGSPVWNHAQIVITTTSAEARLSFNPTGVAPQWRARPAMGDALEAVDQNGTAYINVHGAGFIPGSSRTIKRDIRPLRVVPEAVTTYHDPRSDTVEEMDIMALRPVAFRPRVPAYRLTEDNESVPRDPDTWLGLQGVRERPGLIAEEVETVIPSAVVHDEDGHAVGIDYVPITIALLDHVQRLTEELATLRHRVAELEGTQP